MGIPTYGRPRYLVEAIESVLAQTLGDWRLVIADDGPGGGEIEEVVRPYLADERVSYAPTGTSVSAPEAMTGLIRAGDAPYVALLHDDDRWEPEFLERRVAFLEEHPDCALVFSPHFDIDGEGRETGRSAAVLPQGVQDRREFIRRMLAANVVDTMHSVLARRSAYEACGSRFDEDFRRLFDWEMWLRMAVRFPVGYLWTWDTAYRVHGGQMSHRRREGAEFLRLLEHGERLVALHAPELGLSERERRRLRSRLLMSIALERVEEGDSSGALRTLRDAVATRSLVVADPRFAAVVAGLALGPLGERALPSLRERALRWRRRRRSRRAAA